MANIAVIGAGFAGLSAAAYLAADGHRVKVFEKNSTAGGRARQHFVREGYVFDMGPSWYWMPDVFDRFFGDFGTSTAAHYKLTLLDPGFEVIFGKGDVLQVPFNYMALRAIFDSVEPGSGKPLDRFMRNAQRKYDTAMRDLVYSPGLSFMEYLRPEVLKAAFSLQLFTPLRRHVHKHFRHPKLATLMEFPVLFLGSTPDRIPALYSLMNHAGFKLGTWYPQGGFGRVVQAMVSVGQALGVDYFFNSPVEKILVKDSSACGLLVGGERIGFDAIIAAADYHHVDQELLGAPFANYRETYWASRKMAPSCLLFYIGVRKRLPTLKHHTLFFDTDGKLHAHQLFKDPQWPTNPQFYVGCPSRTDKSVAPPGHENLFLLLPLAPGLPDSFAMREKYYMMMMERLESHVGERILPFVDYRKTYGMIDFEEDYHAFRGNAYGLANTLDQTAWLKPAIRNKKLKNLWYAGQLTVPGPGVPSAIISGKIAAGQVIRHFNRHQRAQSKGYESAI